jgi:ElaB/YqjD/DUF883 family membrane-anchored ribosome-binding protein
MESTFDRATEAVERNGGQKLSSDVETIKASLTQLRRDVVDLLSNAFGLGRHGAEFAKENATDAVESLKARLADLKDRGVVKMHTVEKKIEDNPLPAALIAFGVGFVLAKILTRR